MTGAEALLLGLVQGLTEFLPVSSSGHLVVVEHLMGAQGEGILFEVVVHVATLFAVVVFYRRTMARLVGGALRRDFHAWQYAGKLAVATLPTVLLVLAAEDLLRHQFEVPWVAGAGLLVTGVLVWTTRWTLPRAHIQEPRWRDAVLIGIAQSVAILPGISRSGSTVAMALALGVAPLAAAEFSFLLSVIAVGGAVVRLAPEIPLRDPTLDATLALGFAAALVSGVLALWLFVRLLHTRHFHRFAVYVWAVGALFLAWLAQGG